MQDFWFVTKDQLNTKIGQRIIELRQQKGWSQSDLARHLGKDRQAVEKLENGKVNPTLYSLYEVADVLGVSLSELVELT
ncbi:helix-turn-helix domain-containing protein [Ekhidna sp. To15]|uniref:helix-turn-helix domain-containing protein n=1 Tax=Ekhidna sp. To15 TaxID=3395267 RepID=UPI003F51D3D4